MQNMSTRGKCKLHFDLLSVLQYQLPYHSATNKKLVPFCQQFALSLYFFFFLLLQSTLQSVISSFTRAHFLAICSSRLHASTYSIAHTWTYPGVTWQVRITKPIMNTLNHILNRSASRESCCVTRVTSTWEQKLCGKWLQCDLMVKIAIHITFQSWKKSWCPGINLWHPNRMLFYCWYRPPILCTQVVGFSFHTTQYGSESPIFKDAI